MTRDVADRTLNKCAWISVSVAAIETVKGALEALSRLGP